jgi:SAM-dependent methyltransferase
MFGRFRRRAKPAQPPMPAPPEPDGAGLRVLEPATPESFVAAQYLAANPDVAASPRSRADPRRHFERHGLAEGRLQIASRYLAERGARGRAKFEAFAPLLTGQPYRHLREADAFPIQFGDRHHDLSAYDGESANAGFGPFIEETRAHPDRRYLDVGCGLRNVVYDNCLYLEVYPSLTADLVVDPGEPRYPIASDSMDGIGCFAVLEHVADPWALARELRRILKPGGLLYVDWPFLQPVHGYPSHYFNATRYGLAHMFAEGFETLELATHPNQSADHTMTWLLGEMVRGMPDGAAKSALLGKTVAELLASPPGDPFWRQVTGAMSDTARTALACGNTLVARKL